MSPGGGGQNPSHLRATLLDKYNGKLIFLGVEDEEESTRKGGVRNHVPGRGNSTSQVGDGRELGMPEQWKGCR